MSLNPDIKQPDSVGINSDRAVKTDEEIIESVTRDMKDTLYSDIAEE